MNICEQKKKLLFASSFNLKNDGKLITANGRESEKEFFEIHSFENELPFLQL